MEILQFSKIVPYLDHPLALIGFALFLFFGILWGILQFGLLSQLSQRQSAKILSQILRYGFSLAIALIVLGISYPRFMKDRDDSPSQQPNVTQKAGDCGSNILGNNNQAKVECRDQEKSK
jgi:hypothetical protein